MMTEKNQDYYNEVFKRPDTVYSKHVSESPGTFKYVGLSLNYAKTHGYNAIIEIGCGTGQLIQHLLEETDIRAYIGMDFSQVGIDCCQFILDKEPVRQLQEWHLTRVDLNTIERMPHFNDPELRPLYVCHETFEHFENDLQCLALLPVGSTICISVPNFGGKGHVRFGNAEYWLSRYAHLLNFSEYRTLTGKKEHVWMVGERI